MEAGQSSSAQLRLLEVAAALEDNVLPPLEELAGARCWQPPHPLPSPSWLLRVCVLSQT